MVLLATLSESVMALVYGSYRHLHHCRRRMVMVPCRETINGAVDRTALWGRILERIHSHIQ